MYNRLVKSEKYPKYLDWIKDNGYSIISPKHRGYYAEMIFLKYCKEQGISAVKINSHYGILDQIPEYFLKKAQQIELKIMGKINLDYFCYGKDKGYFVVLKMGMSVLNSKQKEALKAISKSKTFLFRVFEDAEILIKKL